MPRKPAEHPSPHPRGSRSEDRADTVIIVPHTHWDREWHSPFETMRFHLVRFLDEFVDALEDDSGLPCFLLDGQAVLLEDYLEIRPEQEERLKALVAAGRLRPGPFYVQPEELLVSGEGLVRNLLVGLRAAGRFGPVMREGYLPDTFGHVDQLPQILRGFDIETFYAMRGFGGDVDETGSEFWWEAPDGSRVLVHWLVESYSNAAVLTATPESMSLNHPGIVRYDSLFELLDRLSARSRTGVLLLLNGGDHLRLQSGVSERVSRLDGKVPATMSLGGLEDFHRLSAQGGSPSFVYRGEMRYGRYHDVFEGVGSTRTYLKRDNERAEGLLCGVAERLDAVAATIDGHSNAAHLRYAWRELVKNYAHDSICGCSVDAVHDEMRTRFAKVTQVAQAIADDALGRLSAAVTPQAATGEVPVVVVNPSPWTRTDQVEARVLPEAAPPLGERQYGWQQDSDIDWSSYVLLGPDGRRIPFSVPGAVRSVEDILQRRKELRRDRIAFTASRVPPLGTSVYRLVPGSGEPDPPEPASTRRSGHRLENPYLSVAVSSDGTLTVTDVVTGITYGGMGELLDDADAGDEYTFSGLAGDEPYSSRDCTWAIRPGGNPDSVVAETTLHLPEAVNEEKGVRAERTVPCPVSMTVRLPAQSRSVRVHITVDNRVRDHRLRVRLPTGLVTDESIAESAFGVVRRSRALPEAPGWREPPTGRFALRRFVALESGGTGLAVLTRGVHEYAHGGDGTLTLTLLRSVGWLSRQTLPNRPHPVGPLLETPYAQCPGLAEYDLAICPYEGNWQETGLFQEAEETALPLQARAVQPPLAATGHTPAVTEPFVELQPSQVVLTALKTAEDGAGVIVRVVNTGGTNTTAELRFGRPPASVVRTNLNEDNGHRLPVSADAMVAVPLAAGEIGTVRVAFEPGEA